MKAAKGKGFPRRKEYKNKYSFKQRLSTHKEIVMMWRGKRRFGGKSQLKSTAGVDHMTNHKKG